MNSRIPLLTIFFLFLLPSLLMISSNTKASVDEPWSIYKLGTLPEFQADSGNYQGQVIDINNSGQIIGNQIFYGDQYGWGAWIHQNGNTQRIGLEGSAYQGFQNGDANVKPRQDVRAQSLTETGSVMGYSVRYNSIGNPNGQTAWVYNGSRTHSLGLSGSKFVKSNGYQFSEALYINTANEVLGESQHFVNGAGGRSVWLHSNGSSQELGLLGGGYVNGHGTGTNDAVALNNNGWAIGTAINYGNGGQLTSWLSRPLAGSVYRINSILGLAGTDYFSNVNERNSVVIDLNSSNQIIGTSRRYNNGGGWDAWVYDRSVGPNYRQIGFWDSLHTRNDGWRDSDVIDINDIGNVIGSSVRFQGDDQAGNSAWIYDFSSDTTLSIGLFDKDHSGPHQNHQAVMLNELSSVVGHSTQVDGGQSAWIHRNGLTQAIGLTESNYSEIRSINNQNQVIGWSELGNLSSTAWFYDADSDQQFELTLSTNNDGSNWSRAEFLSEAGLALGIYTLYEDGNDMGERAFGFSMELGLFDLESLLPEDELANLDWDNLATALMANDNNMIIGQAVYGSQGTNGYLLSPAPVPIPAAGWLFATALLSLTAGRLFRKDRISSVTL